MVKVNEVFESKYLSAADLRNDDGSYKEINVVITTVDVTEFENDGHADRKLVASFKGAKKQLVLNRTNSNSIAEFHGPDTDNWIGKAIKLVVARVDYQGKRVPAIRIDPPDRIAAAPGMREQAPPAPPKMAASVPPGHPDFQDDVPF